VQTPRLLYIFNPWSNGKRVMFSATTETRTHKRMTELAKVDERLANRLAFLDHRVPEELYDLHRDPYCLNNLIDDLAYQNELRELRTALEDWMRDTQDPALAAFVGRNDPMIREEFMQQQELAAKERKAWINAIKERMKNSRAPTAEPT
jgi:N-sulfoglucosamine sulfohydrolase